MAHQLSSTLPVLVPPENVAPFRLRTLNVTSTPLNTRVSSPTLSVGRMSRFDCPKTFGLVLYKLATVDVAPGSRESLTVTLYDLMSLGVTARLSVTVPPVKYCVNERR